MSIQKTTKFNVSNCMNHLSNSIMFLSYFSLLLMEENKQYLQIIGGDNLYVRTQTV